MTTIQKNKWKIDLNKEENAIILQFSLREGNEVKKLDLSKMDFQDLYYIVAGLATAYPHLVS